MNSIMKIYMLFDYSGFDELMGIYSFFNPILFTIGLFFIFKKCGIKKRWAFIPGIRNYKLAECADLKDDGFIWFLMSLSYYAILIFFAFTDTLVFLISADRGDEIAGLDENLFLMLRVIMIMVEMVAFVYSVRVYLGLCKLFGKNKLWLIAWLFFEGILSIVWGVSKKVKPEYKISEKYLHQSSINKVETIKEGLTININAKMVGRPMRKRYLLRNIHLNIKPGRMVLILGGSGAGKTTFINAVTGYEKADAAILLNGRDVYKEFERMKYEIGFVPQQDLIRYCDTVYHTLDDAAYLRLPRSVKKEERHKRVERVMDILGLAPVKDNEVGKQSGGQKKRISIASEFISDPTLYVLDEPDSGLDGILARDLMRRLHDISRNGKIIMVITHSPDRVLECFDDVIVLGKDKNHVGRLVYYGPVEEAKEFFGKDSMEEIVKSINREEEGGEGRADEFLARYGGLCNE